MPIKKQSPENKFVEFDFYGKKMYTRKDMYGRHKEFDLCMQCKHHHHCDIQKIIINFSQNAVCQGIIWSCSKFEEIKRP